MGPLRKPMNGISLLLTILSNVLDKNGLIC